MTEIKLSKQEAKILTDAAGAGGRIVLPDALKPTSRERLLRRLLRDELATGNDEEGHMVTPTGYRAVGLEPPRAASGSKKLLVIALLRRAEGASLPEMVAATGWLPHTTRAVLSRLRGGEEELAKSKRQDGATSYRLQPRAAEPAPKARRSRRAKAPEAAGVAV